MYSGNKKYNQPDFLLRLLVFTIHIKDIWDYERPIPQL